MRFCLPYSGRCREQPPTAAPALAAQGVVVRYPGGARAALDGLDWVVPPGARVALVGPNGAGKSTLLKAIAGLLPIAAGSLRVFGAPVGAFRHRVAYLAQRGELDWNFPISVRRLVLTGRYPHLGWLRWPTRADWRLADEALARLHLLDLAERQIGELSGGQQQRALLARALAQEADLLLLDEPLNAVDAATREVVSAVLRDLQRQGKTVIVATHDLDRLQADFDDALFLMDGQVVARGVGAVGERVHRAWLDNHRAAVAV
ncbi:MAG: ABC transporter ATP-binding protein [Chloroflexi bacterium]|uniref:ABC transporter ATP-binding protein n=1 Tax=Candidatus Thermofonsia Clade 3 bacterium TaxID=2364212 RepID=A0A2M8QE31_9CHLR|nr:ABC transporter ATP-binding protein [Candidatus Roseilinea sp. NK_OTU-006]PJF48061.1 MAG: ABC transporter ATP-binding protein [Candidatus Thermofonsia Clade 3 bacterium]RMG63701.1 MAG: ABC transporter ATP-binding protein [Chloroflexota bacterium]